MLVSVVPSQYIYYGKVVLGSFVPSQYIYYGKVALCSFVPSQYIYYGKVVLGAFVSFMCPSFALPRKKKLCQKTKCYYFIGFISRTGGKRERGGTPLQPQQHFFVPMTFFIA